MPQKNKRCINCRHLGHVSRECFFPNKSLGIIAFRGTSYNDIRVAMIQRRHSLSFWEFIFGKYSLANKEYLQNMISFMTTQERECLQSCSYEEVCEELLKRPVRENEKTHDWMERKKQFNTIKYGYYIQNTFHFTFINIDILINKTKALLDDTEWEFPKGRPTFNESSFDTAIREFEEETRIPHDAIHVFRKPQLKQSFTGTNGINYNNYYYVAYLIDENMSLEYECNSIEVKNFEWVPINDVYERIKGSHQNKYNVFKKAYNTFIPNE